MPGQAFAKIIHFYGLNPEWLIEQSSEWMPFFTYHMGKMEIESRLELIQDYNAAMNPKSGQRHIRNLQARLEHSYMPLPSKKQVKAGLKQLRRIKRRSRYA